MQQQKKISSDQTHFWARSTILPAVGWTAGVSAQTSEVNLGPTITGHAGEFVPPKTRCTQYMWWRKWAKRSVFVVSFHHYKRNTSCQTASAGKLKQEAHEVEPLETFIYTDGRGPTWSCWPETERCRAAQRRRLLIGGEWSPPKKLNCVQSNAK